MPSDADEKEVKVIRLPGRLFLFCMLLAWLVPFLARLPGVPMRGLEWFTDYLPGIGGFLFISAFNLIPGLVLYAMGKASKHKPVAFWFADAVLVGFLLWAHGSLNLRSSSTAAIALAFIPIYGAFAVVVAWLIGNVLHGVFRAERARALLVGIAGTAAILVGVGLSVHDSIKISNRESRFPVVSVNQIPLLKRTVYDSKTVGQVDVLALANFDSEPGNEIGVLGRSGLALLHPDNYAVKSISPFAHDECDHCVHMYPYLAPDGKGHIFVASSDGLSDSRGHLIWPLKAVGFTRLVPIQVSNQTPTFFSYQSSERVDLHKADGSILWSARLNVNTIGSYTTPAGEQLPFALTGYGKFGELRIYDIAGKPVKTIPLPEWASEVTAISWPERGNLLVGAGSRFGVLDSQGKEVFKHDIRNTSFNPYHGPEGVAVRFDPVQEPYLAVMCHGSSGYARSVLLIFDPKGRLVWQEELKKMSSILAVPEAGTKREILLVGGMDGVLEYKLDSINASSQQNPLPQPASNQPKPASSPRK